MLAGPAGLAVTNFGVSTLALLWIVGVVGGAFLPLATNRLLRFRRVGEPPAGDVW